jgi:hypothetical protein
MAYDPFRGYDRWKTTDRSLDAAEAEWDAYETWCNEQERTMLDNPAEDADWQAQCAWWNRLADEEFEQMMADCNEEAF